MKNFKELVVFKTEDFRYILGITCPQPRPHLIFLFNNMRKHKVYIKKYKDLYQFDEIMYKNFLESLIKSFSLLDAGIFSIHFGLYKSKDSPHFHGHYFLDINDYKKYLKNYKFERKNFIEKLNSWPIQISEEGRKYKVEDLKIINNINKENDNGLLNSKENEKIYFGNVELIFHSSQPRIGFQYINNVNNNDNDNNKNNNNDNKSYDYLGMIKVMMSYIKLNELNIYSNGGCHLCVCNNMYIDEEFSQIYTYLQVDIVNYYKLNPNRKKWLENFVYTPYYVLT